MKAKKGTNNIAKMKKKKTKKNEEEKQYIKNSKPHRGKKQGTT